MADDTSPHDSFWHDPAPGALDDPETVSGQAEDAEYWLPGDAVVELQDLLLAADGVEGFMQDMAYLAAGTVGDGLSCGITLKTDDQPVTAASSDALARKVDEVQYELRHGPCLHSMRTGQRVLLNDLRHADEWTDYAAHALEHGVGASLSVPLHPGRDTGAQGALNLYAPVADAFGPDQIRRAERYAQVVSGAVAVAIRIAGQAALTANLQTALASRAAIDQAIGVIMARRRCPPGQAFEILRQTSQNTNVKLRDVAAALLADAARRPPRPPGSPPNDHR
ncbi:MULTISPECIES: GAF and ANTAR domain-containing protein [Actinomadura]|uniref:ANTAR domain-containing protein n=1 Tax=Actinomadura yumaensis TaxID=111807 RepID=A0ABW2CHZ7_9ACTN|nr:GAF and ANTAR domain-containing protein [Actinomadura sp. J1-007]MWK39972.1 ANTAR domain-containing protein [Actinomadura sp. J1-007]